MEEVERVVIVGAGVSGLATALGLHRKGIRSLVLESSESLRAAGFAILTWPNAWRALDALGVADFLRQTHLQLQGLVINSATSGVAITKQSFTGEEQCMKREVRFLKRIHLLEALAMDLPPDTIRYSSKVVHIEEFGKLMLLHLADGSTLKTERYPGNSAMGQIDHLKLAFTVACVEGMKQRVYEHPVKTISPILIGSDGVNSVVAKWLGLRQPSFSGRSACRGLTDCPPQTPIFDRGMIKYFFGEGFRVGISYCDNETLYWFFTWSPSNQAEIEAEGNTQQMRDLMLSKLKSSKIPEEVIGSIEKSDMGDGLVSAPLRFRWPFDLLSGRICKDNVCVVGDALHPMTPDLGQGGCSALEDAVVLTRCLDEGLAVWSRGFPAEEIRTEATTVASVQWKSTENPWIFFGWAL